MATVPAGDQVGVFKQIIQVLRDKPAYALIFGVILLVYFVCVSLLALGVDPWLKGSALAAILLTTVVAFLTVRAVEGTGAAIGQIQALESKLRDYQTQIEQQGHDLAESDKKDVNVSDPQMAKPLRNIIQDIREAAHLKNDAFKQELCDRLALIQTETRHWAIGELITDAASYDRILHSLYENARESVFATSNEEFLPYWRKKESNSVINAHACAFESHRAQVTRVFTFSTFDDISGEDFSIIKNHCGRKFISGKIFIFDEAPKQNFGPALLKDFVVIDQGEPSQVVGITNSFEVGAMSAKWTTALEPEIEQAMRFIRKYACDLDVIEQRLKA